MDLIKPNEAIISNRLRGPCLGNDIILGNKCNINKDSSINFPSAYNFASKPYLQNHQ